MDHILSSEPFITRLESEVKQRGDELAAFGNLPHLAIIVAGEDPAIRARARAKVKYGSELGMAVEVHEMPTLTSHSSLMKIARRLSGDSGVDGILIEYPLPEHLSDPAILEEMNWEKDVSGFHPVNLGKILAGQEKSALIPLRVQACLLLLEGEKLSGCRSTIFCGQNPEGHALASVLLNRGASVVLCNPEHPEVLSLCQSADILVTALDRPGSVHPDMLPTDSIVIDAGYTLTEQGWVGDLDGTEIQGRVKAFISAQELDRLTPVLLFRNLVAAAEKVRESVYAR